MADPEFTGEPLVTSAGSRRLTRRTVLRGLAGAAGVAAVPAVLAACGPAAESPSGAPSSAPSAEPSVEPSAAGSVTFGSNYSDETPKNAMQAVVDAFTAETGIEVKVNTVDHGTFQDQISSYLQGTPDDVWTWDWKSVV